MRTQFLNCNYIVRPKNNSPVSSFLWEENYPLVQQFLYERQKYDIFFLNSKRHCLLFNENMLIQIVLLLQMATIRHWEMHESDSERFLISVWDTDSYQTWMNQKKKFSSTAFQMLFHLNPQNYFYSSTPG